MSSTAYQAFPIGTVLVRRAGGQRYRVVHPPVWLIDDAVATINVDTGVWSAHSTAVLARFYEVRK